MGLALEDRQGFLKPIDGPRRVSQLKIVRGGLLEVVGELTLLAENPEPGNRVLVRIEGSAQQNGLNRFCGVGIRPLFRVGGEIEYLRRKSD